MGHLSSERVDDVPEKTGEMIDLSSAPGSRCV